MGTTVSLSSPEPEGQNPTERALYILNQKPLKYASMLRLHRIINDSSAQEKLLFYQNGVLHRICAMIGECGKVLPEPRETQPSSARRSSETAKSRRKASSLPNIKGVGYGFGTTKSRWDMEKTVEQQVLLEERLTWLLSTLTSYLYCAGPDFGDPEGILEKVAKEPAPHMKPDVMALIKKSAVIPLLEYHLRNESVFDVSEHMELYEALMEAACSMALYSQLLEPMVQPQDPSSLSVVRDLIPKFRQALEVYLTSPKGQIGSPDFRMVDFIQKVQRWAEMLQVAAHSYFPTASAQVDSSDSSSPGSSVTTPVVDASESSDTHSPAAGSKKNPGRMPPFDRQLAYISALKPYQVCTWRFIGDYGKLAVPFSFKKEAKSLNPFSPSMKDRTKRIAKELATLQTSLPLSASNSVFICVDEGRCDIMKIIITGPDDTPYQNGCFEFDVFFPSSYPFSPPKISFLTTGGGMVRFNPNLYNDGKVCLSILGTWEGRPEEKWNPYCSLLQVLISIQGLIFVKEPYFNEPGFERYVGTQRGSEFSKRYNHQIEHATLQFAIRESLANPSEHFKGVILRHFWHKRGQIIEQAQHLLGQVTKDIQAFSISGKTENSAMDFMELGVSTLKNCEKTVQGLTDELLAMAPPPPDDNHSQN